MLEFQVLGALAATNDGRAIALGGAKQRAFLTILLLHPGQPISRDRLVDALWGDESPASAGHSLEVYASALRKAFEGSDVTVSARSGGYALDVDPERIDAVRFERLAATGREALAEGDAAAAREILGEALALWRGPALADVEYESFAQADAARLDELRLSALEDRFEADLHLGRSADLVAELRAVVSDHPLRERAIGQLMQALYRSGRQAEALDVYRDARERLAGELGIDPSPSLRALETAVLQQADELTAPLAVDTSSNGAPASTQAPDEAAHADGELRKLVSALALELRLRSSTGGDVDPERRAELVARLADIVGTAVGRAGGIVPKPGELVAVFGVPRAHEDDVRRALLAAFEIRDEVRGFADDIGVDHLSIDLRLGVSAGEVVTAALEPAVAAADVLDAARAVARLAPPGEIAMAEHGYGFVHDDVVVDEGAIEDDERRAFVVRSVAPAGRSAGSVSSSVLVDRIEELALARRMLERAVATSRCHLFTIVGSPGLGKTRLVAEFARSSRTSANVVTGRCLPFGDGITFWPIAEAVREAAGIDATDTVDVARDRIRALLADESDGDEVAEAVSRLIGLSDEPPASGESTRSVRRLFEALARERPVIVVIEDLHWAEPTLLDLISGLVDRAGDEPVLIVCTARPEFLDEQPSWGGGKTNSASVLLQPLSEGDSSELLRRLLGDTDLPGDVATEILATADGNPLFLEQILSMLIDEGMLARGPSGWAVVGSVTPIPIPPTIHALLASRVDRLEAPERATVQRAAVIGKEFAVADIEALSAAAEATDVPAHIASLVEKEWIARERTADPRRRYRFRHVLLQAAAYDSIPKRTRADLHERIADRIEEEGGARVAEVEELIGHHLAQAVAYRDELGMPEEHTRDIARRAAQRLRSAGDRAFLRGDMPGAVSLLSTAASLFPLEDADRVSMLPRLGTALVEVARFDDAMAVLTEAWDRSTAAGNLAVRADALFYLTELRAWFGILDAPAMLAEARAMLPALEREGLHASLARCHRLLAIWSETVEGYRAGSEVAMEHARRAGDRLAELEILQNLADATVSADRPVAEALATCAELVEIAGGDAVAVNAIRVIATAQLLAVAGRFEDAREEIRVALDAFDELGLALWKADSGAMGGAEVEMLAGDLDACARFAAEGLAALEAMGAAGSAARHLGKLAAVAYYQGRLDDAEAFARVGRERGATSTIGVEAMLAARAGTCAEAEDLVRDAIDRSRRAQEHVKLQLLMQLAEVLRVCGRNDEATDVLTEIRRRADARGDVASPALASSLIEQTRQR